MAAPNKTQPPATVTSTKNTSTAAEHAEYVSPLEHDVDEKTTVWQLLFANPKLVAYSVAANTGSLLFGYEYVECLSLNGTMLESKVFEISL
jgi:hypothetical protein